MVYLRRVLVYLFGKFSLALGADDLTFEHVNPFGPPNLEQKVLMGTIVSAMRAGELPEGNVEGFVGSWSGSLSTLFQTWWTAERPLYFTKELLTRAMATKISRAKFSHDWRYVKDVLKDNWRYVAERGYKDYAGCVAME